MTPNAELKLVRLVERTALLGGQLMGWGVRSKGGGKGESSRSKYAAASKIAVDFFLRGLKDCELGARVIHPHPLEAKRGKRRSKGATKKQKRLWPPETEEVAQSGERLDQVDLVAAPVDGLRELLDAQGAGSVSLLVAGSRGSFTGREPDNEHAGDYLVLVVPAGSPFSSSFAREGSCEAIGGSRGEEPPEERRCPECGGGLAGLKDELSGESKPRMRAAFSFLKDKLREVSEEEPTQAETSWVNSGDDKGKKRSPKELGEALVHTILDHPLKSKKKGELEGPRTITVGTMGNPDWEEGRRVAGEIRWYLGRWYRPQAFLGSSVAASLAVLVPDRRGVDALFSVVERTQTVAIAAAALATGGTMYALPVRKHFSDTKKGRNLAYTVESQRVLSVSDFIVDKNPDVFLIATGITENLAVRGLRFSTGEASTSSVVLRCRKEGASPVKWVRTLRRIESVYSLHEVPPLKENSD